MTRQSAQTGARKFGIAAPQVSLETPRFRLRSLRPSDASAAYLGWIGDAEVMNPLNMPARTLTLDDLKAHISQFDDRHGYLIGMFDKETGRHFGVYLIEVMVVHRLAKMQYLIGERAFRGIGAFRETAAGLVGYMFAARGIEKMAAQVATDNAASIAGLEAIGFRREGEMRGEIRAFDDGRRIDQYFYAALKTEWRAPQSAPES